MILAPDHKTHTIPSPSRGLEGTTDHKMHYEPEPPGVISSAVRAETARRRLARARLSGLVRYWFHVAGRELAWNWHHDCICEHLEAVTERQIRRLLICVPPGSLKSTIVSQLWHAWMIAKDDSVRSSLFSAGGTDSLARRDSRETLATLRSEWFRRLFSVSPIQKATENEWATEEGAYRMAIGCGAQTTGFGAHHLLWDDLLDFRKAWSATERKHVGDWMTDAFATSRLRDRRTGTITGIMQRICPDDPVGVLLDAMEASSDVHYELLVLPMDPTGSTVTYSVPSRGWTYTREPDEYLHPGFVTPEALAEIRATMSIDGGSYQAQYNQAPETGSGDVFSLDMIKRCLYSPDDLPEDLTWYLPTDPATSTKDTADCRCAWPYGVDRQGRAWWHPCRHLHGRERPMAYVRWMIETCADLHILQILCEGGGITHALRDIFELAVLDCIKDRTISWIPDFAAPPPITSKRQRAFPLRGRMELGRVMLPDVPFVRQTVIPEMLGFTGTSASGETDDIVDTLSLGCRHLIDEIRPSEPEEPPELPPRDSREDIKLRTGKRPKHSINDVALDLRDRLLG